MTLLVQFPNYLINKTIVLNNQQLLKFYENSDLQKFFKKLDLTWGGFFRNITDFWNKVRVDFEVHMCLKNFYEINYSENL